MSKNLGWLFYKDYFEGLDFRNLSNSSDLIKRKVQNLINYTIESENISEELGNAHLKATTTYPGLILGSGNLHELPSVEGQVILGFHFDYTTGLPVIQGSSIKGVLRSAFKHPEYIQELLEDKFNSDEIKEIETEIFENKDIFFDAEIISQGQILADDYLAPHNDSLKNPIPLRFIKVRPNVTFRFDFELNNGILKKDEKLKLFQNIIEDLGLGAKTNVGYGKFENVDVYKTQKEREEERLKERENKLNEAIENRDISELEGLKTLIPDRVEFIEKTIEDIKKIKAKEEIKTAFDKLNNSNQSNQSHIDSFIRKHKDNELAKEFVEKLNNLNSKKVEKIEFDLSGITKFRALEGYLKKFKELDESQLKTLEEHILQMNDRIRRRKFPFGTLQRFFSKEKANELADKLELK